MSTFKRASKLTWATAKEIKEFLEPILDSWETNNYSAEEVQQKASLIINDAKSGELTLNGHNIYIARLAEQLALEGIVVPKDTASVTKPVSKYA